MDYDYDVITIGGGLGGAALARTLADKGMRVLVLEHEAAFRDRVRGELVHPWGVGEARALGIYDLLKQTCAHAVPFRFNQIMGLPPAKPRDLAATSPHGLESLSFYHPEMQQVLLDAAERAGADVQRGVASVDLSPGSAPSVRARTSAGEQSYRARLVVGADGRTSACRKSGGFTVHRDADRMVMAGVLFTGLSAPDNTYSIFTNPKHGEVSFQIPVGGKRFRCYSAFYQQNGHRRLSGRQDAQDFVVASVAAGSPRERFEEAEVAGPLASFNCAETWVEHPYRAGVALIGDAASSSDPTFGCGLSLTLRDARVLSNLLITETDWDQAAHAFAAEHDRYFSSLHRILGWLIQLLFEPGTDAASKRERAFARMIEDPRRVPDVAGLGPEAPSNDAAYANLFGEN